jgi:hypothetical protein
VRSNTLSWIADFLPGRSQEVVLEGKHSAQCRVTSGVPQGTALGPLLFLAYINDMPPCVTSRARLFADDCLLYRPIKTEADATKLQEDIDALQNWESTWQLSFNPDKCEYYASPTSVIRSWQIIISTPTTSNRRQRQIPRPYHLQISLVEQSRKQHHEEGKFHPSLHSTQHPKLPTES